MDYGGNISDASEDIFSDDDGTCDVRFTSPEPKASSPFLNLSQTPVLFHRKREETPGKAIVPKTPLSLAPFISKADDWTSDLETPESKRDQVSVRKNALVDPNNLDITQTADPVLTPLHLKTDDQNDEIVPSSQENPPRKKQKRHPKRRIFDKSSTRCSTVYENDESDDGFEKSIIRKSQSEPSSSHLNTSLRKLEELKELEKRLREKRGLGTLGDETIQQDDETIPDDEFMRSCRALEMCDRPQRERNTQPTPSTSSSKNFRKNPPLSPMWEDLETLPQDDETLQQEVETLQQEVETIQQETETIQQGTETIPQETETIPQEETLQQETETIPQEDETIQQTISQTPQSPRESNFSQINLGIDDIDQEDDISLEETFIMDDDDFEIKKEPEEIEDGFRGFTREDLEHKELWEFQRMFVRQFGGLSPKKLDFPGFSFVESEIAKTISQNNEIFLDNYLEKYYGIRKQVDPLVITIEDTESEASQPTQHDVPQLHPLAPLIVSVYSGFDTAGGNKLFISVDKIVKEQSKLQKDEPMEMMSIDLLISQDSTKVQKCKTKVQNSIRNVQILEVKSKQNDRSTDETSATNIENNITSLRTNLSRDNCDKIIPPVSSPKVAELPDKSGDLPGCVGFKTLEKPVDSSEKTLSKVSELYHEDSRDYADCLNEISNLKSKSRSLRLKRVETSESKTMGILSKEVDRITRISDENCDPGPLRTSSPLSPQVPDDDQHPMNIETPRDVNLQENELECETESIVPPTFDYDNFPQLRNTEKLLNVNSNSNGRLPGFATGNGDPAEISEKAWSRGKTMFADAGREIIQKSSAGSESSLNKINPLDRNKSLTSLNVQRQEPSTSRGFITSNDRSFKTSEEVITSKSLIMGFTTGSGGSIPLSEAAQEKIKTSMREFSMDLDDKDPNLLELSSMKQKLLASRNKRIPEKTPEIKRTSSVLNIQRSSLPPISKPFIPPMLKKPEPQAASSASTPTLGFTTAGGGAINLSEAAQERIKTSMKEFSMDLDEEDPNLLELSSIKKKLWASRNKGIPEKTPVIKPLVSNIQRSSLLPISKPFTPPILKKPEPKSASSTSTPTLGFTTAGGGAIKLSEAALEQMKAGLEAYSPDVDENDPNLADLSSLKKKVSSTRHEKSSDLISKTLSTLKTPITRSELPLKRTSLPFMSKPFTPVNAKRPEIRPQSTPSTFKASIGFTTAGGGQISLSDAAQEKIKADLKAYEENIDGEPILEKLMNMKSGMKNQNSAKRKNPSDDVTPFGRKRARTSGDLQARVLFSEINEEDEEIIQSSLTFENNQDSGNDRNLPFKNAVTDEVRASTAAFFEDLERNSERPASRWSDTYPASSSSRPSERRPYSFPNNSEKSKSLDKKLPLSNQELIPDDVVFDSQDFLESYEKMSTKIKLNETVEKKRNEAISRQENIIRLKKINRERRIPGSLIQIKERDKDQMISLQRLCSPGTSPSPRSLQDFSAQKIDPAVSSINSSTSGNYQFNLEEFYRNVNRNCVEGITVGDGAVLIPNEHNLSGVTEFKRSFLASPGVDPTLIPENWVENHYKWIVWKLASMDRVKFSGISPPKYLTPDRVLKQLKYRYDREIDRAERPVLRRILEKDDAPARRMILCVSRITKTTVNREINFSMELTDGWYSIPAALDLPMTNYILSGKIREGTKLMTYGAQLMNTDEGCHPLDCPEHVRLKIHTNSTRRAKWYTKLGLQKYDGPMELSLSHIHPNGGLIGKVSAVVSRLYPIIYKETTQDGQVIFRNAKSEEKAQMSLSKDGESRGRLRDVTPCLKIRITDGSANGIVTIWQNAEECSEMFKEGNSISIIHGTAAGKRSNELQINATRWTTFDVRACKKKFTFPGRIFTPLSDTMTPGFTPNYGEFDTVGIVVSIGPAPHGMKNFETVNLAYRNAQGEDSFLSILFWEGVVSYGYSDIATIGSIICCINCEWRRNTYRSIPTAFCNERTIITRNPRRGSHLRSEFDALGFRIGDTSNYVDDCATRIQSEVIKKSASFSGTPGRRSGVLTPKNRGTEGVKSKLDKLQVYNGPIPKLSPINMSGSSRVSQEFKSPLTKTARTESSGGRT